MANRQIGKGQISKSANGNRCRPERNAMKYLITDHRSIASADHLSTVYCLPSPVYCSPPLIPCHCSPFPRFFAFSPFRYVLQTSHRPWLKTTGYGATPHKWG